MYFGILKESILLGFRKLAENSVLFSGQKIPQPLAYQGRMLSHSWGERGCRRSGSTSRPCPCLLTQTALVLFILFLVSHRYSNLPLVQPRSRRSPQPPFWASQAQLGLELVVPSAGWISVQGLPRWLHQSFSPHISIMWIALLTKPIIFPPWFSTRERESNFFNGPQIDD